MTLVRWVGVIAVIIVAWQSARAVRGYQYESRSFRTSRGPVPRPDDAASLGLMDVSFPSRVGGRIGGWYIPSRNRAVIILCHGSEGDRRGMLAHARALAPSGYGILLFDWPGHGESSGVVEFGAPERAALQGAVDFLESRSEIDPGRIGAVGFSTGSYLLAQVASFDSRIRAVVLEGAFGDAYEQTRAEYGRISIGSQIGALLVVRTRMDARALRPADVVARISPRPLVIVAGDSDVTVPPELSRRLYEAARAPKEFWAIKDAGHGEYLSVDKSFGKRLVAFFEKSLDRSQAKAADGE
jgi:pimeloyl-ACP methyl ester carboxylesterase